jgi:hypothetical protein
MQARYRARMIISVSINRMPKKAKAQRTLIDGLTPEQDELLRTVQYRQGILGGRDTLYLAVRDYLEKSGEQVKQPTKRQVGAWVKGETGMQRQQMSKNPICTQK